MSIKIVGQLLRLRFKYIRDSLSIRRKLFDKNYQDMDKENHDYGFKAQTEIGQVFKLHFFFQDNVNLIVSYNSDVKCFS